MNFKVGFKCVILFLFWISGKTILAQDLNKLIGQIHNSHVPDSIIKLGNDAVQLAQQNKKPEIKAHALIYVARGYSGKGEYKKAENALISANEIIQFLHIDSLEIDYFLESGRVFQLQNDTEPALISLKSGLDLSLKSNNVFKTIKAYAYLAEYYRYIGEYAPAQIFIKKAYQLVSDEIPVLLYINVINRYAAIKTETGDLDSSLYYSNIALSMSAKANHSHFIAVSLNEIGFVHENKGNFKSAIRNYIKAENIWDSLGYQRNLTNALTNHARCLSKLKNYSVSNSILKKLIAIAEMQNWYDVLVQAYEEEFTNYYEFKDYENAILSLKKQNKTALSLLQENQKKEIETLATVTSLSLTETSAVPSAKINHYASPAKMTVILIILLIISNLFLVYRLFKKRTQ